MSFKHRIGNFLLLFGVVAFLVFIASLLATPKARFDVTAFLAAAAFLVVGVNFRFSKSSDGPLVTRASSPASAKSGPPSGGKPGGGKPGGPPKKQSIGNKIMKGPADKRLPPKPGPGAGPGKPPSGGRAGGGKPGGGKPPGGKKE
jgi:hypothetical protein